MSISLTLPRWIWGGGVRCLYNKSCLFVSPFPKITLEKYQIVEQNIWKKSWQTRKFETNWTVVYYLYIFHYMCDLTRLSSWGKICLCFWGGGWYLQEERNLLCADKHLGKGRSNKRKVKLLLTTLPTQLNFNN